ncbi:MAG: hypothetical protein IPG54_13280 [Sphingomonadales bacterium]|jgi:hypothetical protein|nr:hypothetical protein [Sphingomonadales bacterium]MBK9004658.1 hypothetical protein [Sphingomonadales bacterium]MBK9269840.1 hypothetical protein [Sphingomonadales bacterium]MBP6433676.1 hypothetical protein [Sphingorhabdus sp.]
MPGFKGRAIIYPGLLIAGWIVGRSISLSAEPAPVAEGQPKQRASRVAAENLNPPPTFCPSPVTQLASNTGFIRFVSHQAAGPNRQRIRVGGAQSTGWVGPLQPFRGEASAFALTDEAPFTKLATPDVPKAVEGKEARVLAVDTSSQKRLHFYGYNFWRQGSTGAALAPAAQYGGSQYGAIATWDPLGSAGKGPALLVRGSGTPDGVQQEVAVGARWQPDRKWPISLSLERRFRFYGPDGFAAYVAGGVDRVPIVGRLALDAYGQAGYSLGGISSPFVDAHARVQHPLAKPLGIPIRIGAGAWVGGQKGAYRADVGPTLSAQVDSRFADFTLQLDWRKRVVGNADPVDGLALTVATDF